MTKVVCYYGYLRHNASAEFSRVYSNPTSRHYHRLFNYLLPFNDLFVVFFNSPIARSPLVNAAIIIAIFIHKLTCAAKQPSVIMFLFATGILQSARIQLFIQMGQSVRLVNRIFYF